MLKIEHIQTFSDRYISLQFENESEPKVYDTLLIREDSFEKLNDSSFFNTVKISSDFESIIWDIDVSLSSEYLFKNSIYLTETFNKYFDVPDVEDARDVVHDCYYEVLGEKPSDLTINRLLSVIPKDISNLANNWGWSDTEVREDVYLWIKKILKK